MPLSLIGGSLRARRTLAIALLAAALAGCATIATLSEQETKNKIFSGTIRHGQLRCAHATCLDFPFSLVADAVLLPVTIPWSVVNAVRSDGNGRGGPDKPQPPQKRE